MQRKVLDNGLVVIADAMEGKKKAQLSIRIKTGSQDDPLGKEGVAHLLEHMMFRSNEFISHDAYVETAEFNGISMNASTSRTDTDLDFNCPPEQIYIALQLAHHAITCQQYNPTEFTDEKNGPVATEILMRHRSPTTRFGEQKVLPHIFQGSPIARPTGGTIESISTLNLDDLLSLKARFYHPDNMIIVGAGNINQDELFRKIDLVFGNLSPFPLQRGSMDHSFHPGVIYEEIPEWKDPKNSELDQALYSLVYGVHHHNHPDILGLFLLTTIFGSGMTSRLFRELRVKNQIGYTPSTALSAIGNQSIMEFYVPGLKPFQLEQAHTIVQCIIQETRDTLLPENFFEGKKVQYISQLYGRLDSITKVASAWLFHEVNHPSYFFKDLPEMVKQLTREEVRDTAQRNLSSEPFIGAGCATGYKNPFTQHLKTSS